MNFFLSKIENILLLLLFLKFHSWFFFVKVVKTKIINNLYENKNEFDWYF